MTSGGAGEGAVAHAAPPRGRALRASTTCVFPKPYGVASDAWPHFAPRFFAQAAIPGPLGYLQANRCPAGHLAGPAGRRASAAHGVVDVLPYTTKQP
jgi:hypothetical protein